MKSNLTWVNSVSGANVTCTDKLCGTGGALPFGFQGILAGAAQSFYALIGFDVICTTGEDDKPSFIVVILASFHAVYFVVQGEEVKDAKRIIPIAIMVTLGVVVLSLTCVSFVLSLMMPYYMLDVNYPFATALYYVNISWANYVVTTGAIISLAAW